MPRWDFRCPQCGRVYELHFYNYDEMVVSSKYVCCDDCLVVLDRQPAAPAFVLKGTGFHVNDYPKK